VSSDPKTVRLSRDVVSAGQQFRLALGRATNLGLVEAPVFDVYNQGQAMLDEIHAAKQVKPFHTTFLHQQNDQGPFSLYAYAIEDGSKITDALIGQLFAILIERFGLLSNRAMSDLWNRQSALQSGETDDSLRLSRMINMYDVILLKMHGATQETVDFWIKSKSRRPSIDLAALADKTRPLAELADSSPRAELLRPVARESSAAFPILVDVQEASEPVPSVPVPSVPVPSVPVPSIPRAPKRTRPVPEI
jgi:hypothetical protein